jgi:hypothetical protein
MEKRGNDAARRGKGLSTRFRTAQATPWQGDQPKPEIHATLAPGGGPVALSRCSFDTRRRRFTPPRRALLLRSRFRCLSPNLAIESDFAR